MSSLGNFVWAIADQLRGPYKPHQYGGVILPFTILRRLDCILEPTRDQVQELAGKYEGGALDIQVKRKTGLAFYNTSRYDFARLLEDPEGLRANLIDYLTGFSSQIDVFERFKFETEIATLDEKNRLYLIVSQVRRGRPTPRLGAERRDGRLVRAPDPQVRRGLERDGRRALHAP